MNRIEIGKDAIAKEKLRRKKEKSDSLQAKFAPTTENGFWEFCKFIAPDFYNEKRPPLKKTLWNFAGCYLLANTKRFLFQYLGALENQEHAQCGLRGNLDMPQTLHL